MPEPEPTLAEMRAAQDAFERDGEVEFRLIREVGWSTTDSPTWDWPRCRYRPIQRPREAAWNILARAAGYRQEYGPHGSGYDLVGDMILEIERLVALVLAAHKEGEPRDWWLNCYPATTTRHGTPTEAERLACDDRLECVHVREVFNEPS